MRKYASLRGKLRICIVAWSHLSAKDINLSWGSELRPSQAKPSLVEEEEEREQLCLCERNVYAAGGERRRKRRMEVK